MKPGYLLDTHVAVWSLYEPERLSRTAASAIEGALRAGDPLIISAITLVEICYLCEKGRLPDELLDRLLTYLDEENGLAVAPLERGVATALREVSREAVPDMPDRIIAGTALSWGYALITADSRIRDSKVETVW